MGVKVTVGFRLIGTAKNGEAGAVRCRAAASERSPPFSLKYTEVRQHSPGSAGSLTRA